MFTSNDERTRALQPRLDYYNYVENTAPSDGAHHHTSDTNLMAEYL